MGIVWLPDADFGGNQKNKKQQKKKQKKKTQKKTVYIKCFCRNQTFVRTIFWGSPVGTRTNTFPHSNAQHSKGENYFEPEHFFSHLFYPAK